MLKLQVGKAAGGDRYQGLREVDHLECTKTMCIQGVMVTCRAPGAAAGLCRAWFGTVPSSQVADAPGAMGSKLRVWMAGASPIAFLLNCKGSKHQAHSSSC